MKIRRHSPGLGRPISDKPAACSLQAATANAQRAKPLLYGLIILLLGIVLHLFVAPLVLALPRTSRDGTAWLPWLVGPPSLLIVLGSVLILVDLFVLLPRKRRSSRVRFDPPPSTALTVVLTAYNDEASIGLAVADFLAHPLVRRVVVVDNASRDQTSRVATDAGAIVVREDLPGYGSCVWRALQEGAAYEDTELVLLCEGDCTFRAFDIDKFMAYIPHADIVNGTRIVEQLRSAKTQLTTFMYYGNFFVGKLLEAKHLGAGTFTDIGTTYKLCRKAAVDTLLPRLNRGINLEFNAHFLDVALTAGLGVVECPIAFFARTGESKGGNTDNWRAFAVGIRMIRGLLLGWPAHAR